MLVGVTVEVGVSFGVGVLVGVEVFVGVVVGVGVEEFVGVGVDILHSLSTISSILGQLVIAASHAQM